MSDIPFAGDPVFDLHLGGKMAIAPTAPGLADRLLISAAVSKSSA